MALDWELECAAAKVAYKSSPLRTVYRLSDDMEKSENYVYREIINLHV